MTASRPTSISSTERPVPTGPVGPAAGHQSPTAGLLEVGRIAKAHGLRGEVLVALSTDRTERVKPGSRLTTETGRLLTVVRSSPHHDRFIVAFEGLSDRTGAEALHGRLLHAPPVDDPDALFVHELIGSAVVDLAGAPLGMVEAVEANPASDLLVLAGGVLIPVRFISDRSPGRLVVDLPEGLLDL